MSGAARARTLKIRADACHDVQCWLVWVGRQQLRQVGSCHSGYTDSAQSRQDLRRVPLEVALCTGLLRMWRPRSGVLSKLRQQGGRPAARPVGTIMCHELIAVIGVVVTIESARPLLKPKQPKDPRAGLCASFLDVLVDDGAVHPV